MAGWVAGREAECQGCQGLGLDVEVLRGLAGRGGALRPQGFEASEAVGEVGPHQHPGEPCTREGVWGSSGLRGPHQGAVLEGTGLRALGTPIPLLPEQVGPGTRFGAPGAQGWAVRLRNCCTMLVWEVSVSPTRTPPSFTYSVFAHKLQVMLPHDSFAVSGCLKWHLPL